MTAQIQFSRGIPEEEVPDVRVTRGKSGESGTATFYFENPKILAPDYNEDITGCYLIDEEGEIVTREVKAKFINGQAAGVEAIVIMESLEEWDRFMRFMERYAEANGLGFTSTKK
ncbi:MAG: photosystem II reaction center protein Psb28 [Cyanobacteria bacterium P01_E01_bin.42]